MGNILVGSIHFVMPETKDEWDNYLRHEFLELSKTLGFRVKVSDTFIDSTSFTEVLKSVEKKVRPERVKSLRDSVNAGMTAIRDAVRSSLDAACDSADSILTFFSKPTGNDAPEAASAPGRLLSPVEESAPRQPAK